LLTPPAHPGANAAARRRAGARVADRIEVDAAFSATTPSAATSTRTLRALWSERSAGFDAHWRELGDFLMPRRTRFWPGDRNKDNRRNQNIIDSTGRFAARTLSSGLHAGLTSPARPWMKLTTPDTKLAEQPKVKQWLDVVTQRMLVVFATSNLYNVLPLVYLDMGVFGTGAMSIVPTRAICSAATAIRSAATRSASTSAAWCRRSSASTSSRCARSSKSSACRRTAATSTGRTSRRRQDAVGRAATTTRRCNVVWIVKPNDYADARETRREVVAVRRAATTRTRQPEKKFLRESRLQDVPDHGAALGHHGRRHLRHRLPRHDGARRRQAAADDAARKGRRSRRWSIRRSSARRRCARRRRRLLPATSRTSTCARAAGLKPIHEVNLNLGDLTAGHRRRCSTGFSARSTKTCS
jgi:hypothetical protein